MALRDECLRKITFRNNVWESCELYIPDYIDIEFFHDDDYAKKFNQLSEFKKMELRLLLHFLDACEWVQAEAAKRLGISARQLNYMLDDWGIKCRFWKKKKPKVVYEDSTD